MAFGGSEFFSWNRWTWSFRNPVNWLLVPEMGVVCVEPVSTWAVGPTPGCFLDTNPPAPHAHGDPNWKEQGERGRKFMLALGEVLSDLT